MTVRILAGGSGTEALAAPDTDFHLVTELYDFNGTNGATNRQVVDSSSNGHTITTGTDVEQTSFGPFAADEGKWSYKFDRSSLHNYISPDSSSDFAFGTGDFTIECWCYLTEGMDSSGNGVFCPTTGVVGPALGQWNTNGWQIYHGSSSTNLSDTSYPQNEWVHVAMVRASNVLNLYQNGVKVTSDISDSSNYTNTGFNIGFHYGTAFAWDGLLSNFRVVKGTAVYTSNFTPPTAPLTAITNTVLLTLCSNRHRDKSTSAHNMTTSNPPKAVAMSPYKNAAAYDPAVHGGSAYFGGSTNGYVKADHASLFDLGTNDYCLEAWVYPREISGVNDWHLIFDVEGANNYWGWTTQNISGGGLTHHTNSLDSYSGATTENPQPYQWSHVVFQRTGGIANWYVNGTRVYEAIRSHTVSDVTGIRIGNSGDYNDYRFFGYATDFRVTTGNGYNPYSNAATLTVPTAPLTTGSYTRLLINFTNGGITDRSGVQPVQYIAGNAALSTAQQKFGSASLALDGTGDYLQTLDKNHVVSYGDGDWTVECFVRVNSLSDGYQCIYHSSWGLQFYVYNNYLSLYCNNTDNGSGYIIGANTSATLASANTWYHVAAYRSGSNFYCSIDGTVNSMGSSTASIANPAAMNPQIGVWNTSQNTFHGYIDDFRITRKARYGSSNFTAPTLAHALN